MRRSQGMEVRRISQVSEKKEDGRVDLCDLRVVLSYLTIKEPVGKGIAL